MLVQILSNKWQLPGLYFITDPWFKISCTAGDWTGCNPWCSYHEVQKMDHQRFEFYFFCAVYVYLKSARWQSKKSYFSHVKVLRGKKTTRSIYTTYL